MERMQDLDPVETGEWVDSLRAVLHHQGGARATYLLERLAEEAGRAGIAQPSTLNTPYVNTIPPQREERANWDRDIEHRIRSIIRWNAVAIILRANKESSELGGHIASFQSAATLYDIGFGHFWRAPSANHGGDLIYMQGHSAPGIYARAFVEGRFSEQELLAFRQEVGGGGLSIKIGRVVKATLRITGGGAVQQCRHILSLLRFVHAPSSVANTLDGSA